jgi:beta-xylosidase
MLFWRVFLLFTLSGAGAACAGQPQGLPPDASIANFDGRGFAAANQISQVDIANNKIDAHESGIRQFDGVFYWYGERLGCGFRYNQNPPTPWCGFAVYSSTDLSRWTDNGFLFDPTPWQNDCASTDTANGCWRLNMVYNARDHDYVAWFENGNAVSGYSVLVCATPTSGCIRQPDPLLTNTGVSGDSNLFVDDDGTAYLVYSAAPLSTHTVTVERLTPSYTNSTQIAARVTNDKEAPALFKKGATYYASYSSLCAYCSNGTTYYSTASSPIGAWTFGGTLSEDSCGGQQASVDEWSVSGRAYYIFQSDLWNGSASEALANKYWAN